MNKGAVWAGVFATTLIGFLGGTVFFTSGGASNDPFQKCRGTVVGGGEIGGPFTLTDENGKQVTDKDVITEPSLVYFGYTFCPDVCPLDNSRNAEAVDIMQKSGHSVTPLFISFDPERDTPEVLRDFTDRLHPKMLGMTGTPEQIKAASMAYKTYFKRQEESDPDYYLIDHSTFTYLMFPGIGFVDFFDRDTTAQEMADRTACFIDAAK